METRPPSPAPSPAMAILNLDELKIIKLLGRGATGTVVLVHDSVSDPSASSPFALKFVNKSSSISLRRTRFEIQILRRLCIERNPFLPHLLASVESSDFFAWALPYCSGGDLNVLRQRQNDGVFSSTVIKFYLAEIICALDHLHSMGIAYRDLKPENILIQESGHVTLTDFDLCCSFNQPNRSDFYLSDTESKLNRKNNRSFSRLLPPEMKKTKSARVNPITRRRLSFSGGEQSNSIVGTYEYVSPEVIRGDGHDFAVDWWALGILTYELMYGETPFKGKDKKEIFRNVLIKEAKFAGKSTDLTDLIRRLLVKDPMKRLGYYRGAAEIKEHDFFKGVKWDLLTEVLRPPFIPFRDNDEKLTAKTFSVKEYFQKSRTTSFCSP